MPLIINTFKSFPTITPSNSLITFVQDAKFGFSFSSSLTTSVTLTDITPGNTIVVIAVAQDRTPTVCYDNVAGTYVPTDPQKTGISAGMTNNSFYKTNHRGGDVTVTMVYDTTANYRAMWVTEWAGVDSNDPTNAVVQSVSDGSFGIDGLVGDDITTTVDDVMLLSWVGNTINSDSGLQLGTGYEGDRTSNYFLGQYKNIPNPTTIIPAFTNSNTNIYTFTSIALKPFVDPIPTDELIIDLDASTMFTSGGTEAVDGEKVALWGNKIENEISGATNVNISEQPTLKITEDGHRELDFSGGLRKLSLGQSDLIDWTKGGRDFTIIMQSGDGPHNVYWISNQVSFTSGGAYTAFGIYNGSFDYNDGVQWVSESIAEPTTSTVMTMTRETGGMSKVYQDTVEVISSTTGTFDGSSPVNDLLIGATKNLGTFTYDGTFRRVLVWNRVLTTEEQTSVYNELIKKPKTLIPTQGLVVDLDAKRIFTSGGTEAVDGEEVTLWGNNVSGNQVSGATPFNTPPPVMTISPDGYSEIDFSSTNYGLSLGQSSDLDFGGYSASTGEFTIIMQSGAGAKDVYWVQSSRGDSMRVQDYAFDWYDNRFYYWIGAWRSTPITWPTTPSVVTITREKDPGTSYAYLDNVEQYGYATPSTMPNTPLDRDLIIGSNGIGDDSYTFDGTMRRVLIWNRVLSDVERTLVHEELNKTRLEIDGLVSLWDSTSIDLTATTENDLVVTWVDRESGNDATQTGVDTPSVHLAPTRQVRFTGSTWMNVGQPENLNFVGGIDEFSVVIKLGDLSGSTGYFFSKAVNNGDDRQYAILYDQGTIATIIRGEFYYLSHADYTLTPDDLIIWTVSTTAQNVTANDTVIVNGGGVNNTNTPVNTANVNIGCRTDGSFAYDGDIEFIAVYNKVLTSEEITDIKNQFQKEVLVYRVTPYEVDYEPTDGSMPFVSTAEGGGTNGIWSKTGGLWNNTDNTTLDSTVPDYYEAYWNEMPRYYSYGTSRNDFTLPNGSYKVKMYVGEQYGETSGSRLYDIIVQGVNIRTAFSNWDEFGEGVLGCIIVDTEVTAGLLEVDFVNNPDAATWCNIEIFRII